MSAIRIGTENSRPLNLHYEDYGTGKPVVLIHGWPLNGTSWEKQIPALLAAGHRVIAYDRRGFGRSSHPAAGYDYDTFAEDLQKLMVELDLRDAALVGFSMGGGEVARYIGKFGTERVSKAAILSGVPPYLRKAADNPEGVPASAFREIEAGLKADRPAFLEGFFKDFFNADAQETFSISDQALHAHWITALQSSALATAECVQAWGEDFRADVKRIDIPTLVMQGEKDRIVPWKAAGARMATSVKGSRTILIDGAPHGILWTHADRVNKDLTAFLE